MDLLVQQEERIDFDRYHAEGAAILSKVRIVPKEVRALHVSLFVCMCQSCTRPSVSSTAFIC